MPIGWPGCAAALCRRCKAASTIPTRRSRSLAAARRLPRRRSAKPIGACTASSVSARPSDFPSTGRAAHDVEDVLRPAQNERRGLTDNEIAALRERLLGLRDASGARNAARLSRSESDAGLRGRGMRIWLACGFAIVLCVSIQAEAQQRLPLPLPRPGHAPRLVSAEPPVSSAMPAPAMPAPAAPRPRGPLAEVTLADIGFVNGLRFANLGGHRELFVPLPQRGDVDGERFGAGARRSQRARGAAQSRSAGQRPHRRRHRARRQKPRPHRPHSARQDQCRRTAISNSSFLYSGAATLDRCIDVRYVGDSLTIRPETAVEVDLGPDASSMSPPRPR